MIFNSFYGTIVFNRDIHLKMEIDTAKRIYKGKHAMVKRGRKKSTGDAEKCLTAWLFAAVIGLVSVFVVGSAVAQNMTPTAQTIEGLRLPLQRHENGRVQSMLVADRAWMTDNGVSGEGNIRVFMMSEDGTTNGVAGAERAILTRRT